MYNIGGKIRARVVNSMFYFFSILLASTPALALAAPPGTLKDIIETGQRIVATALPPLVGLALLTFFYGVIQYLTASQRSPDAAIKGRSVLLWGIIVLFVLVSVWGIVNLVRSSFGLGN